MNPVIFEVTDFFLRETRLRDRLRCPKCQAVGTYKPHGGWWDRIKGEDVRRVRRWLCKWCGWYRGPEGSLYCVMDEQRGHWSFPEDALVNGGTPEDILKAHTKAWPWRG